MGSLPQLPAHHPHDEAFVENSLAKLPLRFRPVVGRHYEARFGRGDKQARFEANTALRELVEKLPQKAYRLAADDAELIESAKRWAARCQQLAAPIVDSTEAYSVLAAYAKRRDITPPDPIGVGKSYRGAVARLLDEQWWRRAIRRDHGRTIESLARRLFLVHKGAGIYSSDETLYRRRGQKTRNRRMLDEVMAVNELGQEYTLTELAELSVSNPAIRRGELMMRIAGFEECADHIGHVGEFITITCPSRMHKATICKKTGRAIENPKFDGTTPAEAQKYLGQVWARIRAKLDRHGIKLYGFRVAEPHHDGCPHWHFLVFFPAEARELVRDTFKHYALQADGDEPGADRRRVTFKAIDRAKGTAAGYIAKYIAKNIDGHAIGSDLYGTEAIEAAERVDAWAACWGIRQFQQLGGPSVTVWRELRRMHDEETGTLEDARIAADTGDWFNYVQVMGGPTAPRKEQPIRPAYWQEINHDTGELPQNRYGEEAGGRIFGVQVYGTYHMTRWHQWETRWRPVEACGTVATVAGVQRTPYGPEVANEGSSAPVPAHAQASAYAWEWARGLLAKGASPQPWSSVNNCTMREAPTVRRPALANAYEKHIPTP